MPITINFKPANDIPSLTPATRAYLVLGVNYPLFFLAFLFVSARILVKTKLRKLGREDVLIVFSTVIALAELVLTTIACKFGFGRHITDIHPSWHLSYGKLSYASIVLGGTCYPLTKVSMLFFYISLAPYRTFTTICYISIAYITLSSTVLTFINLFGCTPVKAGWDHDLALHSKCIDASIFLYIYSSCNAATDILLMVLPIPILMRMQLRMKVKLGVIAMFGSGIMITGLSAYGVYAMYYAFHSEDVTWDGARSWMWALVEFNAGIITACMPSMLAFVNWVRGDLQRKKIHAVETATIGRGGGSLGRRCGHNKRAVEIDTTISRWNGSEEDMMEVGRDCEVDAKVSIAAGRQDIENSPRA